MEKEAKNIPEDEWYDYAAKWGPAIVLMVCSLMTLFSNNGSTSDYLLSGFCVWYSADELSKMSREQEQNVKDNMAKYPTRAEALKSIDNMRKYVNEFK